MVELVIPFKWYFRAEELSEWFHYVTEFGIMCYLIYQSKPTPYVSDVSRGWIVQNSFQVFWEWLNSVLCDSKTSKIDVRFSKLKLYGVEHYATMPSNLKKLHYSPPVFFKRLLRYVQETVIDASHESREIRQDII